MKFIYLLIIIGAIFGKEGITQIESNDDLSLSNFKRIIDGNAIGIKDAPYQVSLERYYKHSCGGALINAYFIITAAHCLIHITFKDNVSAKDLQVRAGTSTAGVGGITRRVQLVRTPNNFHYTPPSNDIGIVQLRLPIKISNTIKPIALNANIPKTGDIGTITGYGSQDISYFRTQTHILMLANVSIFDKSECIQIMASLGFSLSKDMVCAGYRVGHRDACQGDSGGPMTINGSLAGVISWGLGCGVVGRPGIYTGIANQLEWIQKCLKSIMLGNKKC